MSQSPGHRFLDLVERSVIVQGTTTLGLVGASIYLWVTAQEVPAPLLQLTYAMLGIFIGGKIENAKARRAFPSDAGSPPLG